MRSLYQICFSILFCSLTAVSVSAHEQETLFNVVQLYANVEREIPNEEMRVTLVAEHQGSNPAEIASQVNADMDWALKLVGRNDGVDSRTMAYNTSPIYRDRNIIGWRASQELELKGREIPDLTRLIGELQGRLQVRQMGFSPTQESRNRHENELIELAMEEFKRKVEIVRKHMDDMDFRIINLNINSNDQIMPRMAYAERATMAMSADVAPVVDAGTSRISVNVNGSVQFFR